MDDLGMRGFEVGVGFRVGRVREMVEDEMAAIDGGRKV